MLKGKWWRPEELGLVDYSNNLHAKVKPIESPASETLSQTLTSTTESSKEVSTVVSDTTGIGDLTSGSSEPDIDPYVIHLSKEGQITPLIKGIEVIDLDEIGKATIQFDLNESSNKDTELKNDGEGLDVNDLAIEEWGDGFDQGIDETDFVADTEEVGTEMSKTTRTGHADSNVYEDAVEGPSRDDARETYLSAVEDTSNNKAIKSMKIGRCKKCGEFVPRDMEMIEKHLEECSGQDGEVNSTPAQRNRSYSGRASQPVGRTSHSLAGIPKQMELLKTGSFIIVVEAKLEL
jgi:hypothetical protein